MIQGFHDDNVKQVFTFSVQTKVMAETPEYIIRALTQDSYSKVKEFIDFKEKLERSHTLNVSRIECVLSHLQRAHTILEYEAVLKENAGFKFPYSGFFDFV